MIRIRDEQQVLTDEQLNELQSRYDSACAHDIVFFEFEGRTMVTQYAKYLLEYARVRGWTPRQGVHP